jgi:hypothetical protein
MDKIFYSLGRITIPTSIVNIIVVGTYIHVGGGLESKGLALRTGIGKLEYTIMLLSFTTI